MKSLLVLLCILFVTACTSNEQPAPRNGNTFNRAPLVAESYGELPIGAIQPKGHLLLQDHGDKVHFRIIKVRKL